MAKRVLVVEDNELNLKLFCDLLRAHGNSAEPVRDGRQAVDRARSFNPDLVVMDIQLPHVTGYELIRQLKADPVLRTTPIMAVTAYAGREDEERIRVAGADAYVSKPISLARFIDSVNGLLERDPPAAEPEPAQESEAEPQLGLALEPAGTAKEPPADGPAAPENDSADAADAPLT